VEQGRVAIVTGGEQGIGWGIASRLEADGWRVVAAGLSPGRTPGSGVEFRPLDVRDRELAQATIADIADEYGRLDLLVNNAGIQRHARTEEMSWQDWTDVIDVNLNGVFNCLQAAGRIMLAAGEGSIVNIASIAVVGLTQVAAVEWAPRGVRVNAVGPGFIDTGVMHDAVAHSRLDPAEIVERIPAGRFGGPADIAAMVAFLASAEAAYITGQVFFVDGGFLANYGIGLDGVTR
jgi:3-oxoacyl-[acyl-carrier protein] reductase